MPEPYPVPPHQDFSPYNPGSGPPTGRPPFSGPLGEAHRGGLILVLGILGLVMCPILGIIAWVMGKGDLAKIKVGQMDPDGRGLTQAGMICGIIATVLLIFNLLLLCLYFGLIFLMLGAAAGVGGGL
jgi:hypothetical protein